MRKLFVTTILSVVLLSGCSNSGSPSESDSVPAQTTVTSSTTSFEIVNIAPAYTSVTESTTPPIWDGNSGILDPETEFDYPFFIKDDFYESIISLDSSSLFNSLSADDTFTLADSATIANTAAYEFTFMGMKDDSLLFEVMNKLDSEMTFDFKCLNLNNLYVSDTWDDPYNISCSDPNEIRIRPKTSVNFSVNVNKPAMFKDIVFKEMHFEYTVDGRLFYGRVLSESGKFVGHIYTDIHKAYKPLNYEWMYDEAPMFVMDGLYGYKSSITSQAGDSNSINMVFGIANNNMRTRDIRFRFVSVNGQLLDDTDKCNIIMQPCSFATLSMSAYFGNVVRNVTSIDMEVYIDGVVQVMKISFEEPLNFVDDSDSDRYSENTTPPDIEENPDMTWVTLP